MYHGCYGWRVVCIISLAITTTIVKRMGLMCVVYVVCVSIVGASCLSHHLVCNASYLYVYLLGFHCESVYEFLK